MDGLAYGGERFMECMKVRVSGKRCGKQVIGRIDAWVWWRGLLVELVIDAFCVALNGRAN